MGGNLQPWVCTRLFKDSICRVRKSVENWKVTGEGSSPYSLIPSGLGHTSPRHLQGLGSWGTRRTLECLASLFASCQIQTRNS